MYDVVKDPKVVTDSVTRSVLDHETVPVTRSEVYYITASRAEYDVVKVPQTVTRLVQTPKVVKDVQQVTRIHKYPVHVTRFESVPVTRTRSEKVAVPSYGSYGANYDFKVVSYQDVEKRVVQDTIFETKLVSDPVVHTRQEYDQKVESDTVYLTKQVSQLRTEKQPREKVVTEYVSRPVSRVVQDTVTRTEYTTRQVTRQVYDEQTVKRTSPGGWDKCMGPFNAWQATEYGIDEWECHDNCYTRVDDNGNVSRGCYKGEFGVNPNQSGCSQQAGATYCFCEGELCNNEAAPSANSY